MIGGAVPGGRGNGSGERPTWSLFRGRRQRFRRPLHLRAFPGTEATFPETAPPGTLPGTEPTFPETAPPGTLPGTEPSVPRTASWLRGESPFELVGSAITRQVQRRIGNVRSAPPAPAARSPGGPLFFSGLAVLFQEGSPARLAEVRKNPVKRESEARTGQQPFRGQGQRFRRPPHLEPCRGQSQACQEPPHVFAESGHSNYLVMPLPDKCSDGSETSCLRHLHPARALPEARSFFLDPQFSFRRVLSAVWQR
jgi:hypothetical protein